MNETPKVIQAVDKFNEISTVAERLRRAIEALNYLGMDNVAEELDYIKKDIQDKARAGSKLIGDSIHEEYKESQKLTGNILSGLVHMEEK